MRTVVPFSLNSEQDGDIINWLSQQKKGERSAAIKAAIRAYIDQQSITLADIYHAVQELKRRGLAATSPDQPADTEADPEITNNLDALLEL